MFSGKDAEGPNMEARCAPLTPMTTLSPGRVDRTIEYDLLTDSWTSITNGVGGVFGEGIYRFDDIGTVVEHNLKRELTMSNKGKNGIIVFQAVCSESYITFAKRVI